MSTGSGGWSDGWSITPAERSPWSKPVLDELTQDEYETKLKGAGVTEPDTNFDSSPEHADYGASSSSVDHEEPTRQYTWSPSSPSPPEDDPAPARSYETPTRYNTESEQGMTVSVEENIKNSSRTSGAGGIITSVVNHPKHYNTRGVACRECGGHVECIDVIENFPLNKANAMRYIWRAGEKGDERSAIEDIEKAIWYLNRILDNVKSGRHVDDFK